MQPKQRKRKELREVANALQFIHSYNPLRDPRLVLLKIATAKGKALSGRKLFIENMTSFRLNRRLYGADSASRSAILRLRNKRKALS
ncbi:hypothetical protein SLA2020_453690 [Shorea laevis]